MAAGAAAPGACAIKLSGCCDTAANSASVKTRPADLTDPDFADDSERSLVRKVVHAPRPMPSFERLLSESDRQELVGYLRTLAAGSTPSSDKRRLASGG